MINKSYFFDCEVSMSAFLYNFARKIRFMKYFEFIFKAEPSSETVSDILVALLGEVGFESFVTTEEDIKEIGRAHV